jgi:hypothetical protein
MLMNAGWRYIMMEHLKSGVLQAAHGNNFTVTEASKQASKQSMGKCINLGGYIRASYGFILL